MRSLFDVRRLATTACVATMMLTAISSGASAQVSTNLLASRSDLTAAATQAERAAVNGEPSQRTQNAMVAASIRQRLRDGDLQVGDRVVVTITSDAVHRDTAVVRPDMTMELPGMIVVPVRGLLRSELQSRVSAEVLKYIKAESVEVTSLVRIGIMGSVARPGYFAVGSDVPITDAIMLAGGPTAGADIARSTIRRGNEEVHSATETSKAITTGLTFDQFGLMPGDELVVGQRRNIGAAAFVGVTGAVASMLTLVVALRH